MSWCSCEYGKKNRPNPRYCLACGKSFLNSKGRVVCKVCGKDFTKRGFPKHLNTHKPPK